MLASKARQDLRVHKDHKEFRESVVRQGLKGNRGSRGPRDRKVILAIQRVYHPILFT